MSGIMGIFYLDGCRVDRENPGRMVDILEHREPDGADIWSEGSLSSQPSTEREYHWRNITAGILTQGLEVLDHYAAAFYLEARHLYSSPQ